MPYINAKVSLPLTKEKMTNLKCALGKAIEALPGKSEQYLMVCIEDNQNIWLSGKASTPKAFFDVRLLGKKSREDYVRMTGEICRLADELLDIAPEDVYVTYTELEHWGWNGTDF